MQKRRNILFVLQIKFKRLWNEKVKDKRYGLIPSNDLSAQRVALKVTFNQIVFSNLQTHHIVLRKYLSLIKRSIMFRQSNNNLQHKKGVVVL